MSVTVEFLPGPLTSEMSRTAAEGAISKHPAIQKGAAYALEQLEGRWVAAVVHEAGPFPPPANGGGPDEEAEAPVPKSEGVPGGDEAPGDGPPDDGGEGKPPSDEGGESKEKGGEHGHGGLEHQMMDLLTQIATALGLPIGLGESPVPGPDGPDAQVPPPAGPPHGLGGPPQGGVQKVIHDRVTKPGETPPGGTPVGAPAFAKVREDHPWSRAIGKVASFEVSDQIGDTSLAAIKTELEALASEAGYRVARLREDRDDRGNRVARAVITSH